jgi:hypothetical protein
MSAVSTRKPNIANMKPAIGHNPGSVYPPLIITTYFFKINLNAVFLSSSQIFRVAIFLEVFLQKFTY